MWRLKLILVLLVVLMAGRVWAAAPLCAAIFQARPLSKTSFQSQIQPRLGPEVYEKALRDVDDLLGLLEPLPEGYQVVLKSQYGQEAKNIFAAKRIEFSEVHTTYRKFTGEEDPRLALPILVHEYSHAYFEATMRRLSPQWEQNSSFLDKPFADPQLKQQLSLPLTVYHEFFADLVPALLFQKPAVMGEALQFHDSLKPNRSLPFRSFTGFDPARDMGSLKEIFRDGDGGMVYVYLTPLRNFLWKEIEARNPSPAELRQILRRVVEVFAKDYEQRSRSQDYSFVKMNSELEAALHSVF